MGYGESKGNEEYKENEGYSQIISAMEKSEIVFDI